MGINFLSLLKILLWIYLALGFVVDRAFIIASISLKSIGLFKCLSVLDLTLVGEMHQQVYTFLLGFLIWCITGFESMPLLVWVSTLSYYIPISFQLYYLRSLGLLVNLNKVLLILNWFSQGTNSAALILWMNFCLFQSYGYQHWVWLFLIIYFSSIVRYPPDKNTHTWVQTNKKSLLAIQRLNSVFRALVQQ